MPASDQGQLSGRYKLVPRVLIFLTCEDRLLLLKVKGKPQQNGWAGRYNGIGGHIERGEDVLGAAQRELGEETGLVASSLWLCGVITIDTGQEAGIGLYVLRGECPTGKLVSSEEGTAEWVAQEAVLDLPLVEDLPLLFPRLLAMREGDSPFSAHYRYDEAGRLLIEFFDGPRSLQEG